VVVTTFACGCGRVRFDARPGEPVDSATGDGAVICTPGAMPSVVQSNCWSTTNGTTAVVQFSSPVASGDLLIIALEYGLPLQTPTVTDTLGTVFMAGPAIASATQSSQVFYALAPAAGSDTVQAQVPIANGVALYVVELSVATTLDTSATRAGVGTTLSSPSIQTACAGELLFAFGVHDSTVQSVGGGYTKLQTCFNDIIATKPAAAPGAYDVMFTASISGNWSTILAAFRQ
jgi:hypothetical protein